MNLLIVNLEKLQKLTKEEEIFNQDNAVDLAKVFGLSNISAETEKYL